MAAGGHQGYAALGGLYTQARPMVPHLYGNVADQAQLIPVSYAYKLLNILTYIQCYTQRSTVFPFQNPVIEEII